jgi:Rod binding domain-containing protein
MDPIKALGSTAPLSADQQAALKKLHDAATQLEGVFVGMLFKEMHSTVQSDGIFGPQSNADKTWNDMLDEKRADAIAKTGSFGIAKMVESQLRASVLGTPSSAPSLPASVSGSAVPPALSVPPNPLAPTEDEKP